MAGASPIVLYRVRPGGCRYVTCPPEWAQCASKPLRCKARSLISRKKFRHKQPLAVCTPCYAKAPPLVGDGAAQSLRSYLKEWAAAIRGATPNPQSLLGRKRSRMSVAAQGSVGDT